MKISLESIYLDDYLDRVVLYSNLEQEEEIIKLCSIAINYYISKFSNKNTQSNISDNEKELRLLIL